MKSYIFLFLFISSFSYSVAQKSINNYKYVIVPERYEFARKTDEHQINSLSKFLFTKYGFETYMASDDLPLDLRVDESLALYANVIDDSNMLVTRFKVSLSDSDGEIIYVSGMGKSKMKEFKWAYQDALRKAFESIEELKYKYVPLETMKEVVPKENTEETKVVVNTTPRPKVEVTLSEDKKDTIRLSTSIKSPPLVIENTTQPQVEQITTVYVNTASNYRMISQGDAYVVYDGENRIGEAQKGSGGIFLVKTSDFDGIGRLDGDQFVIEREIKGVEGLVKMIFKKQ